MALLQTNISLPALRPEHILQAMPLLPGENVPESVALWLASQGVNGPVLLGVVREGCPACEDALPLLDAAIPLLGEPASMVRVLVQDDGAAAARVRANLCPEFSVAADDAPYLLSRALEVQFTPTLYVLDGGVVVDMVEAFDPDALQELLKTLGERVGVPGFKLFEDDEPRPRYRPG